MKKIFKNILIVATLCIGLSGCYKENDVIDELWVSKGKVAQISVVWLETTSRSTTVTVDASTNASMVIEYTSELPVKEIRVYRGATSAEVAAATTPYATIPVSAAMYDANLRNYVVKVPVAASTAKNTTVIAGAEVITNNDLPSARKNVTIKTKP